MFVNLVAPINQLGYGVAGFNVLKALMTQGHNVSLFIVGGQATWDGNQESIEMIKKAANNSQYYDYEAPSIKIWHQDDMAMFPGKGERIGWPIFELNEFSDKELHHLNSVDRLFVCSSWAKDVLVNNGITSRIDVIPLGVDSSMFYVDIQAVKNRPYWNRSSTVFLNVGKWEVRKGHGELIEAFNKAFTPNDDVELWMLNHNPFIGLENEQWKARYISSPMGGKIKILPRFNSQEQLRQLYNQVDFGVFPSHAEGWNLEPLELMACGKPSILTNYSGHTEYCDDINSLLVEPRGMEKAQDGRWFHGQGEWCTFDVDELVEKMRIAHNLKQTEVSNLDPDTPRDEVVYSGQLGRQTFGCLETAKRFSWENTVNKIIEAL